MLLFKKWVETTNRRDLKFMSNKRRLISFKNCLNHAPLNWKVQMKHLRNPSCIWLASAVMRIKCLRQKKNNRLRQLWWWILSHNFCCLPKRSLQNWRKIGRNKKLNRVIYRQVQLQYRSSWVTLSSVVSRDRLKKRSNWPTPHLKFY